MLTVQTVLEGLDKAVEDEDYGKTWIDSNAQGPTGLGCSNSYEDADGKTRHCLGAYIALLDENTDRARFLAPGLNHAAIGTAITHGAVQAEPGAGVLLSAAQGLQDKGLEWGIIRDTIRDHHKTMIMTVTGIGPDSDSRTALELVAKALGLESLGLYYEDLIAKLRERYPDNVNTEFNNSTEFDNSQV